MLAVLVRQCGLATIDASAKQNDLERLGGVSNDQKSPTVETHRQTSDEDLLSRHNAGASKFDSKVQFWGKVLDQDGKPVEGVSILASVTTLRMVKTERGFREFELLDEVSNADGSFMFDGAAGFSLTIEKLTKPGYVLPGPYQEAMRFPEELKYRYTYNAMGGADQLFHPDPASPVIFRLWKLRSPEPLILRGTWASYAGPRYQVDEAAMPDVRGAIAVAVKSVEGRRSPLWEVIVTAAAIDGGIAKADADDAFMFEAPEEGYERVQKFRYCPGDFRQPGDGFPVRFFVRGKSGGWFAAVDSLFYPPNDSGEIVTKSRFWLNPSGSRNLEHDSANPIRAKGF